jgi:hypothetical protein
MNNLETLGIYGPVRRRRKKKNKKTTTHRTTKLSNTDTITNLGKNTSVRERLKVPVSYKKTPP